MKRTILFLGHFLYNLIWLPAVIFMGSYGVYWLFSVAAKNDDLHSAIGWILVHIIAALLSLSLIILTISFLAAALSYIGLVAKNSSRWANEKINK